MRFGLRVEPKLPVDHRVESSEWSTVVLSFLVIVYRAVFFNLYGARLLNKNSAQDITVGTCGKLARCTVSSCSRRWLFDQMLPLIARL